MLAELPFLDSDEPNRVFVDLAREGGRPLHMLLDTGAPIPGVLSGVAAQRVGLESRPLPGLGAAGVWGPVEVEFAEAESLRIGPFELSHVPLPDGLPETTAGDAKD